MNKEVSIRCLFVAAVITIVFGTIYAALQQDVRQSANDPQIQLAEDTANDLSLGFPPADLIAGAPKTDIAGLSPFIMIYDSTATLVGSTGYNSTTTMPVVPSGVFDYVRAHGEDRITWQTPAGDRFATVIDHWSTATTSPGQQTSGFVLAARNLKEIEKRGSQTGTIIFVGWIASVLLYLAYEFQRSRRAGPART